jgi:Cu2+-exporting ATPase
MLDKVRTSTCHHCLATMPEAAALQVSIAGTPRAFCCHGCASAAQLIEALSLQSFYDYRNTCGTAAPAQTLHTTLGSEDYLPALSSTHDGTQTLRLLLPDIRCVACVWLLEQVLGRQEGVLEVRVNFARRRLQMRFREPATLLPLIALIEQLGYSAIPDLPDARRDTAKAQRSALLQRLGVAGLCMMPVMMFALASYLAGSPTPQNPASGMDPLYETLLRWASFALTTPVVLYSAGPFHRGAWQSLRHGQLGMDLPVSLAILAAWVLSIYNTLSFGSVVYFDTACMFTFLLLLGRHVELLSRQHFEDNEDDLLRLLPGTAWRARPHAQEGFEPVPLRSIMTGDVLRVLPGETIPADGILLEGSGSISDSAFTGEPLPVLRTPGARVLAGATNHDGSLLVRASCGADDFLIAQLARLHEDATAYRPRWTLLADRAASGFIGIVLVLSLGAGVFWYLAGAEDYWVIALTVLVVACPCALSLATPVAITVATTSLRRHGVLIRNGAFLERAARTTAVAFDKTGTLTEAALRVEAVATLGTASARECLAIATALERHSQHPIARAFVEATALIATEVDVVPGGGVRGLVDGVACRIGQPAFACEGETSLAPPSDDGLWVLLCRGAPLAWIQLQDTVRADARATLDLLRQDGILTALYSGDSSAAGRRQAASMPADIVQTSMKPEEKISAIRALGEQQTVMMVGDGINDTGAMAAAACSVAVTPRDVLVQHSADATLLSPSLTLLPAVLRFARRTRRIIRQNLLWSLAYNLSAIPLALLGLLPPWLAAIGMSLSSLLVVLNAGRLRRLEH